MITSVRLGAPDYPILGTRRKIALGFLCTTLIITSLDNTILNIALPTLVRVLHATNTQLEWIVDAYAVASAGLLIFAGSLSDRVGHKRLLVSGSIFFTLGSAVSAFSGSVYYLVLGRAIMGVGAACIMPATLSLITTLYRRHEERALAIGIWSGSEGLGIAAGPIIGGWLLGHYWWGSVFMINIPIALIGMVGVIFLIPSTHEVVRSRGDYGGVALSILGMSSLLWGIIDAPVHGWTSIQVVGSVLAGVLLLVAFVLWEHRSKYPLLKLGMFRNRRFSVAMVSATLIIFVLMGLLFVITQYFQFSLGYSPLSAGLRVLPIALILGIAAPASSILDRLVGSKIVVAGSMLIIAVGLFVISTISMTSSYGSELPGLLLVGFGAGLAFPPVTESVMGSLDLPQTGIGSATNSSALQFGGALGVAVIGTVLASRYQTHLTQLIGAYPVPPKVLGIIKGSLGGALAVAHVAGGKIGNLLAIGAKRSFVSGMDLGLKVGGVIAVVSGMIALVFLPARRKQIEPKSGVSHDRRASDRTHDRTPVGS